MPSTTAPSEHANGQRSRKRPTVEAEELSGIFRSYGLTVAQAKPLVDALRERPAARLDFMMRFDLALEKPDPRRAPTVLMGGLAATAAFLIARAIS